MYVASAAWMEPTFSRSSILVFALSSAILLCLGFSVGLHRGVIHRAYRMGRGLECLLLLLAALNGFGGLLSLIRMHELRDHWQNQPICPAYFAHRRALWLDYFYYLHIDYGGSARFEPTLCLELMERPYLRFLERAWIPLQLLLGVGLYAAGGWNWVVWGVFVRIAACLTGVWLVNYVAHTRGYRNFRIVGSAEEGRNSLLLGAISMGEGWHNNHHAYPRSARMGVRPWEVDPGFLCIRLLERMGLVWDVLTIHNASPRPGVEPAADLATIRSA